MTLGPLSCTEMKAYMARISSEIIPEFDEPFLFYHPDLGPTNVMVSEDGDSVAAIIDWEAAAYFPSFWVATKPATGWAYYLGTGIDKKGWSKMLVEALTAKGFECLDTVYTKWNNAKTGPA
jgi:hypothetical protein